MKRQLATFLNFTIAFAFATVFVMTMSLSVEAATLVWDPSSANPEGYTVYWGGTTSSMTHTIDVGNKTSYDLANLNLTPGEEACFCVKAYAGADESSPTNSVCYTEPDATDGANDYQDPSSSTYEVRCSSHKAPFDGSDPLCHNRTFDAASYPNGVYAYIWPENGIDYVEFSEDGILLNKEYAVPWELFGSSSVNELGDYRIDTTIGLLQGGETVLPKVSFTLTEEPDATDGANDYQDPSSSTYEVRCSSHKAPFDGSDPLCHNRTFDAASYPNGVYAYIWPENGIDYVEFSEDGILLNKEQYVPWELFGSSSVNELGDYRIDTTIGLLQGGETVLPKVSFTLTEENVNATQTNIGTQTKIEAESFDGQKGIKTAACSEGGKYVGWINDNDYIMFEGVDFGFQPNQFQARVASAFSGGSIQVRLGSKSGEKIGTCSVPGTNGWQNWETVTCNIGPVSGEHDLYLVFKGSDYGLFNINWFIFAR